MFTLENLDTKRQSMSTTLTHPLTENVSAFYHPGEMFQS